MPHKDPNNVGYWINLYNIAREQGMALTLVFVLTVFRMYRDEKKPSFKNVLLDSISGALTVLVVGLTCKEFGFSYGWALVASGFIGVFGLETVKYFTKKIINKKIEEGYSYKDKYKDDGDEL